MGNPVIYTMPSLYLDNIIPINTQYFMILESRVFNFNSYRMETLKANMKFYHIRGLYNGLRMFIPTFNHVLS